MSKMTETRTTLAKVIKFGLTLPEGIGLLTGDGGLPMFAIAGPDRQISHWLIYLQKVGAGERPALAGQAFDQEGIADMGSGWKLGRLLIPDSEVQFAHKVVHEMEELVKKLNARDVLTEKLTSLKGGWDVNCSNHHQPKGSGVHAPKWPFWGMDSSGEGSR